MTVESDPRAAWRQPPDVIRPAPCPPTSCVSLAKKAVLVTALLALVLSACTGEGAAGPAGAEGDVPTGDALTSTLVEKGIRHANTVSARTDVVFVDEVDEFEVLEDLVVEEVRPLRMDEGVELLEARVAFLRWRGKGLQGPDGADGGYPGAFCTDTWPPKGFRGLYPVEELELRDGDWIVPVYFTRARHAGDWSLEGLVITYRQGNRRYQQVTETFALNIFARDTDEEVATLKRGRCRPSLPRGWLGQ
jgi:hypothetical protein